MCYDPDGLIKCVQQSAAGACDDAQPNAEKLTYDANTPRLVSDQIGKISTTYGYNLFNELAGFTANYVDGGTTTPLYQVTYDDGTKETPGARDALGRVQRKTEIRGGITKITNYTYDASGRLASVTDSNGTRNYTYDANGNRDLPSKNYDNQDRLLSFNLATNTYTQDGEIATKSAGGSLYTYTYDALGNLRKVVITGAVNKTIDYLVDGLGRRVGKKVAGTLKQQWIFRNGLQIAGEGDSVSGKLKSRFFYGSRKNVPDFMERADTGKLYRVISDQLGSPVLVVNTQDKTDVLLDVTYDEWGNLLCRNSSTGAECVPGASGCDVTKCTGVLPFGFAGGLYDSDTGFVRFGARDGVSRPWYFVVGAVLIATIFHAMCQVIVPILVVRRPSRMK